MVQRDRRCRRAETDQIGSRKDGQDDQRRAVLIGRSDETSALRDREPSRDGGNAQAEVRDSEELLSWYLDTEVSADG